MASITVAKGDGIGPEIMNATLHILKEAGAILEIHEVVIGEQIYLKGIPTGIEPKTWDILRSTKAFLKAPITTPQGGGFKSLNVTIRGAFGLFANVRPCVAYSPFVETKHPGMDLIIVRENEEDLYAGIEYQKTPDVTHAIKVISRSGCERIIRYAFEYTLANHRKKVTCFTKDNILKLSDGLFHKTFEEIGQEYPQLEKEHWIVDIGAAKLADQPEQFDVLVMPNLYGDILSDVAAQIAGSVGLAGSANIGEKHAMFEAIHGSAPRRAGQNLANPSGLLLAAIMMLNHLGQGEVASLIQNAWLTTLEEGIHTYDIFKEKSSKQKVGTKEFADAVVNHLGKKPHTLKPVEPQAAVKQQKISSIPTTTTEIDGVDLYIRWEGALDPLLHKLQKVAKEFTLALIMNRGSRIWPERQEETNCVDLYRCRFTSDKTTARSIVQLLSRLVDENLDVVQTDQLLSFNGKKGY